MTDIYAGKDAAGRYDSARALPDETMALWMSELKRLVLPEAFRRVLDLGGGTGRFAPPIQRTYGCPVIVLDPSAAMLQQGSVLGPAGVSWVCGAAERIPLATGSVDLVWMSQVFHHLEDKLRAFAEIRRVLNPAGYLVVRNGTHESEAAIGWIECFPEAKALNERVMPSQADIIGAVSRRGFGVLHVETVRQVFATSYLEYCRKISQRGLSSLIKISDEAFDAGVRRLRAWAVAQPRDTPVYDPVDLFVFRKET